MPKPPAEITRTLDALHCGALLIHRAGAIAHANPRFCKMTGFSADDVIEREVRTFYADDEAGEVLRRIAEEFSLEREGEAHVPCADGRMLPVALAGRLLGDQPPLSDYRVVTIIDITAVKQAEERCRTQYQAITELSDTVLKQALDLKHYSERLEDRVRERTRELHEANMEAIYMLAVASEAKDEDTGAHVRRIQEYSEAVAAEMGMSKARAERLGHSAILHDVGKIAVPDEILKKPGPLTDDERRRMQQHTIAGERILSEKPFFEESRQIARSHHENWNGSGYPDGLSGDAIPPAARIVHLVDVFDALRNRRVYKGAWPLDKTMAMIRDGSGKAFDPDVVRAFEALLADGRIAEITRPCEAPE